MSDLPQKKYKSILSALKKAAETEAVTGRTMSQIAKVHNVDLEDVRVIAGLEGIRVFTEPKKSPAPKAARTTPKQRADIKNGVIYRMMSVEDDPSDDTLVYTTYGQLKRERAAILNWVKDASDGLA